MNRRTFGRTLGVLLTASLAVLPTACSDAKAADGDVAITVSGRPLDTDPAGRKIFDDDLAAFKVLHPNIKITATESVMDAATFQAKLAGGQLENVFDVYFTDPAALMAKKQVADITTALKDFPALAQLRPDLQKVFQLDGKTYGIPVSNYSMGLLYNRELFTKAGLDPDKPPTTWDEVRADAQKITALGDGAIGYGDYSKSNTGGWHFTLWNLSLGGEVAKNEGGTWKAAFNSDQGRTALRYLHDMRWTDNTMGSKQLLEYGDLLQMMGSGKLGMYMAAPDNIATLVKSYGADMKKLGLGALPGVGGPAKGTIAGGHGRMFNAKNTPAQTRAALQWISFVNLDPDRMELNNKRNTEANIPAGMPEPYLWTGDAAKKQDAADLKYNNVPVGNFKPFQTGTTAIPLRFEPPEAQKIYAILDTVMGAVLTNKDADVNALLKTAEAQVNDILAKVR